MGSVTPLPSANQDILLLNVGVINKEGDIEDLYILCSSFHDGFETLNPVLGARKVVTAAILASDTGEIIPKLLISKRITI